jgi:ABC-type sugar transport system substrate-binding protein
MDGKIGLFVNSLSGYQGLIVAEAREAARSAGLEFEVFDNEHTAVQQAQHLMRFEHQNQGKRLCALIIPEADAIHQGAPENDPTFQLARRVLDKGTGFIVLNHGREDVVASLRSKFPELPVGMVVIDNLEFGRMQGRQVRKLLPAGGTVLSVRGNPFDSACAKRSSGLKDELQQGAFVVAEIDARWEESIAEPAVHKWVSAHARHQRPLHAIVAQNDPMGAAAHRALLRAAGELDRPDLKSIPVIGGDGLPEIGMVLVKQGILTATVRVTLPGKPAIAQLERFWRDGTAMAAVTSLPVESHPALAALAQLPA